MKSKNAGCPCKRTKCPRHGDCQACKAHHLAEKPHMPPTCERLKAKTEAKRQSRTENKEQNSK